MKKLMVLLLMLLPVYLSAQKKPVKRLVKQVAKPVTKAVKPNQIIWILDSVKVTQAKIDEVVNKGDLGDVTLLSKEEAQAQYQTDEVGIAFTKTFIRTKYKKIFSTICADYKNFLLTRNSDDRDIVYFIDGVIVDDLRPLPRLRLAADKAMIMTFKVEDGRPTARLITNKEIAQ